MQIMDLENRVRQLCEQAITELEGKTALTKDAVQMLETVNKMITVFYERDATRTEKNPLKDVDISKLLEQFDQ